ncbi:MAG: MinD/ParA family protein, partial [Marinobacter alexandrii]
QTPDNAMLRYEAFTRLFALLGSAPDGDTIEIIQTGLGSLEWEKLSEEHRQHLATHLRHLADQIVPTAPRKSTLVPTKTDQTDPVYDRVSFGEQERLVRALREQPAEISLNELLRSLAGKGHNRS